MYTMHVILVVLANKARVTEKHTHTHTYIRPIYTHMSSLPVGHGSRERAQACSHACKQAYN